MPDPYAIQTADLDRFPPGTRRILLYAALWPTVDRPAVLLAAAAGGDIVDYAPAEATGLITIDDGLIIFTGTAAAVVRAAADAAQHHAAHRALAAALTTDPDRRAWHLAAAADGSPTTVADWYEQAAAGFLRADHPRAAARALYLAAEAAPGDARRAERLVRTLELTADGPRAQQLHALISATTTDPVLTARAAVAAATALILTGEPSAALATVESAVDGLRTGPDDPALTGELISVAASAVLAAGTPDGHTRLAALAAAAPTMPTNWSLLLSGPAPAGPAIERAPDSSPAWVRRDAGLAAWWHDDPHTAVRRLRDPHPAGDPARDLLRDQGLVFALIDNGRWDEAEGLAEDLADRAAAGRFGGPVAAAAIARATIEALRGDGPAARRQLTAAAGPIDLSRNNLLRMLAVRARAVTAIADGDFPAAFAHYCSLFHADGRPAVHWAATRLVAELALASRRVGDTVLVHRVVTRIRRGPDADHPRLRFALTLTEGLIAADSQEARRHLRAVALGPAARAWPGDRAVALLLYGLQLRRERRFTDAEPLLHQALDEAHRLGARALIAVVQDALRANGTTSDDPVSAAFSQLTAQHQDIVRLAAAGLRNREIAARLHLSERTIGSHLYHIFPKLGVAGRRQLRKVVEDVS